MPTEADFTAFADKQLFLDPVLECGGLWYMRVSDTQAVVLRHIGGHLIEGFHPGWSPVSVYTGLGSLYLLTLTRDGTRSTWMVAPDGRRLGDKLADLDPDWMAILHKALLSHGLARPEGLIGNGIQFIEPVLLGEILDLVSQARNEVARSVVSTSHGALAMLGAPHDLRTYLYYGQKTQRTGDDQAEANQTLELQEGWTVDEAGRCRGVGIYSTARAGVAPKALRHLLTLTLVPAELDTIEDQDLMPIEIAVNGRTIGFSRLDFKWQRDGADLAFWLPPETVNGKPIEITFRHSQDFLLVALKLSYGQAHASEDVNPAELMLHFENIGDNCEFGLVQRYFKADPIGLLRFAGLQTPARLIRFLDDNFGGFGEPGSLAVSIIGGEYWIVDHTYGLAYHTFRYQHEIAAEDVIHENEIKAVYLKRKFIEDLEDGEKILVYKRVVTQDVHEIIALHAALNRFGTVNKLLWVTQVDNHHLPGEVEWVGDRLLKGYVNAISLSDAHDFDPDIWLRLCRNAFTAFGNVRTTTTL